MAWWTKLLSTSQGEGLLKQAGDVVDRFIETQEEKKAFMMEAFKAEVQDRESARRNNNGSSTPSVLSYITLFIALALGVAIFSDVVEWSTLSEVQKGLITTFAGFFLRTLGDVYAYWFGSSSGSTEKSKEITRLTNGQGGERTK